MKLRHFLLVFYVSVLLVFLAGCSEEPLAPEQVQQEPDLEPTLEPKPEPEPEPYLELEYALGDMLGSLEAAKERMDNLDAVAKELLPKREKPSKAELRRRKEVELTIEQGIAQLLRIPEELNLDLKLRPIQYIQGSNTVSIKWVDSNSVQAFSAFIKVYDEKELSELDGFFLDKYPYKNWTDWTMNVHVGHFFIQFMAHAQEFKSKEAVAQSIPLLFDLENLSKISPKTK